MPSSDRSSGGGVHVSVGTGSSKQDYHFSVLLFIATIAFICFGGFALGAFLFGFEILNRL